MCLELSHVPGHETHPAPWSRTAWGRGGIPPSLCVPPVLANPRVNAVDCRSLSPAVESVMYDVSRCPHEDKSEHFPVALAPRYKVPVPRGAVESGGPGLATHLLP